MLSLRNLGRRKIRTILTVVSIAIGVAMIVSLLSITSGMEVNLMNAIRAMGGADITLYNASIGFQGFREGSRPMGFATGDRLLSESIVSEIQGIPGVYIVSPLLSISISIGNIPRVVIYGVDISSYLNVSNLNIVNGSFIARQGECVIGKALSEAIGIGIGDTLNITYQQTGNSIECNVVGIFVDWCRVSRECYIYIYGYKRCSENC